MASKVCKDVAETRLSGSAFQILAAAIGKARLPTEDSLYDGTTRRLVAEERRGSIDCGLHVYTVPFNEVFDATTGRPQQTHATRQSQRKLVLAYILVNCQLKFNFCIVLVFNRCCVIP